MPFDRIEKTLAAEITALDKVSTAKRREIVIAKVVVVAAGKGPRYLLVSECDRPFLRMNSNSYLVLSLDGGVMAAADAAVHAFGTGPGAARFISGTWAPDTASRTPPMKNVIAEKPPTTLGRRFSCFSSAN